MSDFLSRLSAYLSQYCDYYDGNPVLPPEEDVLRDAVQTIIENRVMSVDELKAEALSEFSVIVPDSWFQVTKGGTT